MKYLTYCFVTVAFSALFMSAVVTLIPDPAKADLPARSGSGSPLQGTVEYANLADTEAPTAYILWPLVSPFFLGHAGSCLAYTVEGNTLTVQLSDQAAAGDAGKQCAAVQVFRRGPLPTDNYQALAFPGPAYFVGRAGATLPTQYDPAAGRLIVTLP